MKNLHLKIVVLLGAAFILNGCTIFDEDLINNSPVPLVSPNVSPVLPSPTPVEPTATPIQSLEPIESPIIPSFEPKKSPVIPSSKPVESPVKPSINPLPTPDNSLTALEAETLRLINQERAKYGLPALVSDERILKQARNHSTNMANGSVPFGHNGFQERVRATGITYSSAGENVARNSYDQSITAAKAVYGWMNSKDGHRENILGNYNLTGLGVVKSSSGMYYFTQIFIKSR